MVGTKGNDEEETTEENFVLRIGCLMWKVFRRTYTSSKYKDDSGGIPLSHLRKAEFMRRSIGAAQFG